MVLITIVTGAYKPTNITGGPHIDNIGPSTSPMPSAGPVYALQRDSTGTRIEQGQLGPAGPEGQLGVADQTMEDSKGQNFYENGHVFSGLMTIQHIPKCSYILPICTRYAFTPIVVIP